MMNPQFGYRQSSNGTSCTEGSNPGNPNRQQGYRQGLFGSLSTSQLNGIRSTEARIRPAFSSSSGNVCSGAQGGRGIRPRQRVSRSQNYLPASGANRFKTIQTPQYQSQRLQQLSNMTPEQKPLAPTPFCTPQAVKVKITAEQLENAKNVPIYQDRAEPSQSENPNVKYIQLNWKDLIGGMENLKVSMAPSGDCNNQNRLKVSFGGHRTDPPVARETDMKVISMLPVGTTERIDLKDGNALAGTMRTCNTPARLRMSPANNLTSNNPSSSYSQQQQSTEYSRRGTCRR